MLSLDKLFCLYIPLNLELVSFRIKSYFPYYITVQYHIDLFPHTKNANGIERVITRLNG